ATSPADIYTLSLHDALPIYRDRPDPLRIWADSLSVSERNRTAIFSGHVVVTQGAARMQCARLVVHFHYKGSDRRGVIDRFECKRSEEHTSELQSLTNLVCRL